MVSRCNTREELVGINLGENLAIAVGNYHLPDFSKWKNHAAFERAFARLEKDLRASVSK